MIARIARIVFAGAFAVSALLTSSVFTVVAGIAAAVWCIAEIVEK